MNQTDQTNVPNAPNNQEVPNRINEIVRIDEMDHG